MIARSCSQALINNMNVYGQYCDTWPYMGMNASIKCWHGFNYWSANKWIGVFWSYLNPNGLKLQDTHILWLIYSTEKNEKNIILLLCTGIKYKVFIRISSWEDRRIIPVSFHQRWSLYQHQCGEYWLGVGTILDGVTHANLWKSCKMTMSLVFYALVPLKVFIDMSKLF